MGTDQVERASQKLFGAIPVPRQTSWHAVDYPQEIQAENANGALSLYCLHRKYHSLGTKCLDQITFIACMQRSVSSFLVKRQIIHSVKNADC